MLTVLGGLAEFERELIRVRTGEGRTRAVANGVLGRKPSRAHHQQHEAIKRLHLRAALLLPISMPQRQRSKERAVITLQEIETLT